MTADELQIVKARIQEMNAVLATAVPGPNETRTLHEDNVTFTSYGSDRPILARKYREGVNKVKMYWWGIRVWLSRTTVQRISGGVTVAGIWIPEGVVSKVVATLGVALTFCPGGIRFDTTPAALHPQFPIKIWKVHFQ